MNIDQLETMLNGLPVRELKERFAKLYGHLPSTRNRPAIIKRILWAHQRDAFGDISEAARKKALAIADDRDVRERFPNVQRPSPESNRTQSVTVSYEPAPALLPGTVLHRDYQDQDIRVLVQEDGFEWEGKVYKSLSATARAITGTRWNGKLFFGLKKRGK